MSAAMANTVDIVATAVTAMAHTEVMANTTIDMIMVTVHTIHTTVTHQETDREN